MITRTIQIRLKDPTTRREVGAQTRALLLSLPQVRGVKLGFAADALSAELWDLQIEISLDSLEDMAAYLGEDRHSEFVATYLAPRTLTRQVWVYEA